MSVLFAATYPERTAALLIYGSYARRLRAPDYPWAPTDGQRQRFLDAMARGWGGPVGLDVYAPSMVEDEHVRLSLLRDGGDATTSALPPGGLSDQGWRSRHPRTATATP